MRAIPKRHEDAQEHVQRNSSHSHKSGVGGEVEDGEAHWQQWPCIGLETLHRYLTFQAALFFILTAPRLARIGVLG